MAMFSFGAWFADDAFPAPKPTTGMWSSSQTCDIGPDPTMSGYTTGSTPYVSRQAAAAASATAELFEDRLGRSPWNGEVWASTKT